MLLPGCLQPCCMTGHASCQRASSVVRGMGVARPGHTARKLGVDDHLRRAAPRHQVDVLDGGVPQLAERPLHHIRGRQPLRWRQQQPRAVQRHVAEAQHGNAAHCAQVHADVPAVRVAVVPPHELAGRQHTWRFLCDDRSGWSQATKQAALSRRAVEETLQSNLLAMLHESPAHLAWNAELAVTFCTICQHYLHGHDMSVRQMTCSV